MKNTASYFKLFTYYLMLVSCKTAGAQTANITKPGEPDIHTEDVSLFYKVYDEAGGHPTTEQLQSDYLDLGTDGLRTFARLRNTTAQRIEEAIEKQPQLYATARHGAEVLPTVKIRLKQALGKLREIYPAAKFPAITIAIGRGKPVAIGSPVSGVQIGLEALCGITYYDKNLEDRFVHVIAHEYVHVQQPQEMTDDPNPTVLEGSLVEGAADFIGEFISGGLSNIQLAVIVRGHEAEIETSFLADEDKRDLTSWLYNGTMDKSGDIGYWVGYRIVKSYYQHATDKQAAIREIIEIKDPKAFLAKSGWYPGINL
ncbi:MAG TPA: DUF2268 domain-containing putative Zn-dependent protease [Puia sp.]|nr:DUF2268 domain-containing putative Zn-dependent protease [Puia sp.]